MRDYDRSDRFYSWYDNWGWVVDALCLLFGAACAVTLVATLYASAGVI